MSDKYHGRHSIYQEDINAMVVDAIDNIEGNLEKYKVDMTEKNNIDLVENELHDIIINFLDTHFAIGQYRHHH